MTGLIGLVFAVALASPSALASSVPRGEGPKLQELARFMEALRRNQWMFLSRESMVSLCPRRLTPGPCEPIRARCARLSTDPEEPSAQDDWSVSLEFDLSDGGGEDDRLRRVTVLYAGTRAEVLEAHRLLVAAIGVPNDPGWPREPAHAEQLVWMDVVGHRNVADTELRRRGGSWLLQLTWWESATDDPRPRP